MKLPLKFLSEQEKLELEEALGKPFVTTHGCIQIDEEEEDVLSQVFSNLNEEEEGENKVIAIKAASKLVRIQRRVDKLREDPEKALLEVELVNAVLGVYQIDEKIGQKLKRFLK